MSIQKTNEFSICLKPTRETIEAVNNIRDQLAPSPYRDDPPHITLVRGIVSDEELTDAELLRQVADITHIDSKLPLAATVTEVTNKSNKFYSESGGLIVSPSEELRQFRSSLLASLTSHGFSDESYDKNNHPLHITVRLGVKLEGDVLARAQKQFLHQPVIFTGWSLFRLELEDGARKMHEIAL
jgi:2'-5' RNA ligase